ncbi:MAG: RtcB family protein [candidate division KSB1 bacterium]|nr:RtcB family protein [candidate division KSB1 bacterium]MDZ7302425.1 RtcB family protein [candidate division KSB1 bacterium]MDZ7311627.1 RtcB family protein [candidate division KSB1 bacterium]
MSSPIETIPRNGGLPIKFFLTPEMMPDKETLAQLEQLASVYGLAHHVAVLPDIHRKIRNLSPTGTAIAARNMLVPRAVDTGICCGMRMVRTDIDVRDLTAPLLDELFAELMATIPVLEHAQDVLTSEDVADILVHGGKWSQRKFGLSDEEMDCIEDRGTMPTDTTDAETILASVPDRPKKKGRRCFGTLGNGNHFLELQEIVEVIDRDIAKRLGLSEGKAIFMLHTGSRSVGSKTTKEYLEELEKKFPCGRSLPSPNGSPIWSMPADTEEGIKFARAITAASNFGFANRIAITEKLRAAVRKTLRDESLQMPLLYDCAHVSIKREQWNGEKLWIHRNGGSRALPPSHMKDHPIFSQTGQPVPIPASMGHDSFIGVADERTVETFFSVNHGAGRVMDKPEAMARFTEMQIEQEMRDKHIRLYRYGSDNIAEQAPSSFKDISRVIRAMSALSLARPVVRLRPVAVLKG